MKKIALVILFCGAVGILSANAQVDEDNPENNKEVIDSVGIDVYIDEPVVVDTTVPPEQNDTAVSPESNEVDGNLRKEDMKNEEAEDNNSENQ